MERIRQEKKKKSQSTYTITKFRKKNNNQDNPHYLIFKVNSQNSYWKQNKIRKRIAKKVPWLSRWLCKKWQQVGERFVPLLLPTSPSLRAQEHQ
jgi:hypothetical protein